MASREIVRSDRGAGGTTGHYEHALLWNGSAATVVDLNPTGFIDSYAREIAGNVQVGFGRITAADYTQHALMWIGSAESVVDLNPTGFQYSIAEGVAGSAQVGYGSGTATGFDAHALLWNGTADSVVDLHPYLANLPVTLLHSFAMDIDDNGTIVGYAYDNDNGVYAILWTPVPVPEPSSAAILCCSLLGAAFFPRRNRTTRRQ